MLRSALCIAIVICGTAVAQDAVSITVARKPRQTFAGFGTSLTNFQGKFQQLKPDTREQLGALVFRDLDLKVLRLWFSPVDFQKSRPGLGHFKPQYIDSGLIDLAKKNGVTTLLLAPGDVPAAFASPKVVETDAFSYFTDEGVTAYAALLAEFIAALRDAGVTLEATGVLNEPNDRPVRFTDEQWPVMITTLRKELDQRKLGDVRIIAPEAASADDWAKDVISVLRRDKAAWNALAGIATHTYNMGATTTILRKAGGKPYWQTESSTPGPESDAAAAAINAGTTGARVIGDLNHGVTHWIWFIGFEQTDPADDGTRLVRFDARRPDGGVQILHKYHYLKQLSQAFGPGCRIHPCTVDDAQQTEKSMTFTYGRKPAILAAAGQNADGGWAVAIQNYTSDRFVDLPDENRMHAGPDIGRTIEVIIELPKREAGAARFTLTRSGEKDVNVPGGEVEFKDGKATVRVGPLELVTLRSVR